jgi:hypothetical protein
MLTEHLSELIRLRSQLQASMAEIRARAGGAHSERDAYAYRRLIEQCNDLDDAIADLATDVLYRIPAQGEG